MSRINTKLPTPMLHRKPMKSKKPTIIDTLLEQIPESSSSDSDSSSSSSSDSESSPRARAKMINKPPISHPDKNVDPITTSAAQLHDKDADASNHSGINASSKNDDSAMKPNVKDSSSNTGTSEGNDISSGTNGGNITTNEKPGKVSDNNNNIAKYVMNSTRKETAQKEADKEETSDKNTTELVGKDADASKSAPMSMEIFDVDGTRKSAPMSFKIFDADGITAPTSIEIHSDGDDSAIKHNANKSDTDSSNDNEHKARNDADANTKKQVQSLVDKKEQSTILRLKQVLNATEGK